MSHSTNLAVGGEGCGCAVAELPAGGERYRPVDSANPHTYPYTHRPALTPLSTHSHAHTQPNTHIRTPHTRKHTHARTRTHARTQTCLWWRRTWVCSCATSWQRRVRSASHLIIAQTHPHAHPPRTHSHIHIRTRTPTHPSTHTPTHTHTHTRPHTDLIVVVRDTDVQLRNFLLEACEVNITLATIKSSADEFTGTAEALRSIKDKIKLVCSV